MEVNPKVSIIMATYNREKYIVESLKAIQNQTYTSWECIIIDDGGSDNTAKIIAPILEKDERFKFYTRTSKYKKGPSCRNYGLDLAKGDYIIFFDDDDIPHPQNLEICTSELDKRNISFCRYVREVFHMPEFNYKFDYSKEYSFFNIDLKDIENMIKDKLQFNCCAVMWKRECFDENRFAEGLMYAEEWELYSRIVSSGFKGISISKTLFYGRKHENSSTGNFYKNDPIRRASFAKATLLAIENLKKKKLLTHSIIKYFVIFSYYYKDFDLYQNSMQLLALSRFERLKWNLFYFILPLRISIYSLKKKVNNKIG